MKHLKKAIFLEGQIESDFRKIAEFEERWARLAKAEAVELERFK